MVRSGRVLLLAAIMLCQSSTLLGARAVEQSKSRPKRTDAEARLISIHQIDNPSLHGVAMRASQDLDERARKLEREGERLAPTRDFRSTLDGSVSDNSYYRNKGGTMVRDAREMRETAALIRTLIDERIRELRHLANFPLTPLIDFKNPQGKNIRAIVVLFSGPDAVVQREDGQFFQISMQSIAPSYAPLFDMIRIAEFGRQAKELAPYSGEGKTGAVIFSDLEYIWVRLNTKEVEQLPNPDHRDVRRELSGRLEDAKIEEQSAGLSTGTLVSFAVERMLVFKDFPALERFGAGLYQVTIGVNRALLVTLHKAYFSRGRGEMRVLGAGNTSVVLASGEIENVPVMVETSTDAIRRLENAVKARVACESTLEDYEKNKKLYGDLIVVKVGVAGLNSRPTTEKPNPPKSKATSFQGRQNTGK